MSSEVSQFFILVATVASSIFIDRLLRGRFDALLHTTDAECLVQSFRRVLRGLCDLPGDRRTFQRFSSHVFDSVWGKECTGVE